MSSRLLVFALLVVIIVACSHQERKVAPSKAAQQENAAPALAATQRARQTEISRRAWRRSDLRHRLENDELELKNAKLGNEIAELEGRAQATGPERSARAR